MDLANVDTQITGMASAPPNKLFTDFITYLIAPTRISLRHLTDRVLWKRWEILVSIELEKLKFLFQVKPLLIGGKAMEHYSLRMAGADIDFVVGTEDYDRLIQLYPDNQKEIFGDLGVCIYNFELWKSILLFEYEFLALGAMEEENYKIISLDKLLFLKTLAISESKYEKDVRLIVEKIHNIQYDKDAIYDKSYFQP